MGTSGNFLKTIVRLRSIVDPFSADAILIVMAETAEEISKRPKFARNSNGPLSEKTLARSRARGRDKLFIKQALILLVASHVFSRRLQADPAAQASAGVIVRIYAAQR